MKPKTNFIEQKKFEAEWKSKIPSHMIADEDFLRPKYEPEHPLEQETKKYIKDRELVKQGNINIALTEEDIRALDIIAHETTYQVKFNFFSIAVVSMRREVFDTLKSGLKRYIEFTPKELHDGLNYQGEIRGYSKDYESYINERGEEDYRKVKNPMTETKIKNAISFMSKLAIMVIEREFDLRFKNFKNCYDVESESWVYQLPESRELQKNPDADTPFLNILSITRGMDKNLLAKKVLENHNKYLVDYAALLGKYHAIKSQFKNCDNMWDMNILYEDYLNIGMPLSQAEKLGRIVDGVRLNGEIIHGTFGF